jgi:hypothetical protein
LINAINKALEDGIITDREAADLVRRHNQLQHKSREELKILLAQHGISAKDYGMETVDIRMDRGSVDGGVAIRDTSKYAIAPNILNDKQKEELKRILEEEKDHITILPNFGLSPKKRQRLTWLAIVGPSALISLLRILSIV